MSIDVKLLRKILNQVKVDINNLKVNDKIEKFYQRCNDVKIDFSNYEVNGGIGLEIVGRPVQFYSLAKKQEYVESVLSMFKKDFDKTKDKNLIKLIDYYVDNLLYGFSGENEDNINIDFLIKSFVKEVNNIPIPVQIKLKVKGIYLKGIDHLESNLKKFQIIIRRPRKEDFKFLSLGRSFISKDIPSAFIEINLKVRQEDINNYMYKGFDHLLNIAEIVTFALRIFKIGDVEVINRTISYESILLSPMNSIDFPNSHIEDFPRYHYALGEKEFKDFLAMLNFINLHINSSIEYNGHENLLIPLSYNFYCETLINRIQSDKRIAYAVMGLESIYCSAKDKNEVSYKLRVRCAKTLSLLGYNSVKVFDILKLAYYIRSSF